MSDLRGEINAFFADGMREAVDWMQACADEAAQLNVENGDYQDHTRLLRSSNYGRADETGIEIGNSAEYASYVSSKGHDVIDSGVNYIIDRLNRE